MMTTATELWPPGSKYDIQKIRERLMSTDVSDYLECAFARHSEIIHALLALKLRNRLKVLGVTARLWMDDYHNHPVNDVGENILFSYAAWEQRGFPTEVWLFKRGMPRRFRPSAWFRFIWDGVELGAPDERPSGVPRTKLITWDYPWLNGEIQQYVNKSLIELGYESQIDLNDWETH